MKILFKIVVLIIIAYLIISILNSSFNMENDISYDDDDDYGIASESEEKDDDDDDDIPLRLFKDKGLVYVQLNQNQQVISGIKTQLLKSATFNEEITAYANVVPLERFFEDKGAYELIQSDIDIASINLKNSDNIYNNLKKLNVKTADVSSRKLLDAKVTRDLDSSELKRLQTSLQNQKNRMLQNWGKELFHIMFSEQSDLYKDFVNFKQSLILMSLKPNQTLSDTTTTIYVNKNTDRLGARKAFLISSSNVVNTTIQGESYYLHTDSTKLRAGMRLNVWIPTGEHLRKGVVIPDSAVIWYSGMPWAYMKSDDEFFIRKVLTEPIDTGAGWFVSENFKPDDQIVIQGAQLLLSEEFRNKIPDEDDTP